MGFPICVPTRTSFLRGWVFHTEKPFDRNRRRKPFLSFPHTPFLPVDERFPFVPGMVQDAYGIPYASCRVVQLLSLVGFLVHQSQQLVHVDAVDHAGLLHGLTAG